MSKNKNNLKLWQARYILSVKILGSVVFAGTVGVIFYHVPFDSLFLYPLYLGGGLFLLWLYAMEDAKFGMIKEWQDWVDNKLSSPEYTHALIYLNHRQIECSLEPCAPYIPDFGVPETRNDLDYEAFLKDKFKDQPLIQELYR